MDHEPVEIRVAHRRSVEVLPFLRSMVIAVLGRMGWRLSEGHRLEYTPLVDDTPYDSVTVAVRSPVLMTIVGRWSLDGRPIMAFKCTSLELSIASGQAFPLVPLGRPWEGGPLTAAPSQIPIAAASLGQIPEREGRAIDF